MGFDFNHLAVHEKWNIFINWSQWPLAQEDIMLAVKFCTIKIELYLSHLKKWNYHSKFRDDTLY